MKGRRLKAVLIYNNWKGLTDRHKNIVLGLGNFDGLHVGHQKLIRSLVERADRDCGTPSVFTFSPHPMEVLSGNAPPQLLTQGEKQRKLENIGVKVLLLIPFTVEFAAITPDDFIEKVLVRDLGVRSVFVGYNYTFGQGGRGTPDLLIKAGRTYGFSVVIIPPVTVNGVPVSSTMIRKMITDGEVTEAAGFLGYYPLITGTVVSGDQKGRQMGFPTANLVLPPGIVRPANGVYAVKVEIDGDRYLGVANVGVKPTFINMDNNPNLEVHLLDFQGDLYGKQLCVMFTRRIREEKRFSSAADLADQIKADIDNARALTPDSNKTLCR